jgi:hypothetical protein
MGDPAAKVIAPLVLLGIAAASWALRPASRMLGATAGEPVSAKTGAPFDPAAVIAQQSCR